MGQVSPRSRELFQRNDPSGLVGGVGTQQVLAWGTYSGAEGARLDVKFDILLYPGPVIVHSD